METKTISLAGKTFNLDQEYTNSLEWLPGEIISSIRIKFKIINNSLVFEFSYESINQHLDEVPGTRRTEPYPPQCDVRNPTAFKLPECKDPTQYERLYSIKVELNTGDNAIIHFNKNYRDITFKIKNYHFSNIENNEHLKTKEERVYSSDKHNITIVNFSEIATKLQSLKK